MASAYLETTIPSYLTSRPSRDLVVAAHQQLTHDWWGVARDHADLFVSELVLEEIRRGDARVAASRLKIIEELPVLSINEESIELASVYSKRLGLQGAEADILHIAITVAHGLDYLITWNCRHIANGRVIHRLIAINEELGKTIPVITTPEFFLEATPGGV